MRTCKTLVVLQMALWFFLSGIFLETMQPRDLLRSSMHREVFRHAPVITSSFKTKRYPCAVGRLEPPLAKGYCLTWKH